jgi:hypothetical protein
VLHEASGLGVTPHVIRPNRFTVTHIRTGLGVPPLSGLAWDDAVAACDILGAVADWSTIDDIFFTRSLPESARENLFHCLQALGEMFGLL